MSAYYATCVTETEMKHAAPPCFVDAATQTSLAANVAKERCVANMSLCDKNLILVKTIKKYPCLYNHQLSEYSRKDITDKAWIEVANETKQTVGECKEKWKNLRYSFVRSLKPNPDGSSKKKYYLNDEMEYILPYIRVLSNKTTDAVTNYMDYDDSDEETIDRHYVPSPELTQYTEVIEPPIVEPPKKKMKINDTFTNNHPKPSTNTERNDEDLRRMFLLSLLPEVVELTEPQMRKFRRRILELLDDVSDRNNGTSLSVWEAEKTMYCNNSSFKSEPS